MKIQKVINNNVVSSVDENGTEVVVMGRGIGFHAKEGMEILPERVEKVFRLESEDALDQFKTLLKNLPLEHIEISTDIIRYAKELLKKPLNQNIYITLTDHINFAIERFHKNMMFSTPLLREIQSFYKEEYQIGEYGIYLIQERLGIHLPEDEAASMALHVLSAEYNTMIGETLDITELIQQVLDIVSEYFHITLEENSLAYERFITHLRFLARRIYNKEFAKEGMQDLSPMIEKLYPAEYACSQKIQHFIQKRYAHKVTEEEVAYLAVHIRRIVPEKEIS